MRSKQFIQVVTVLKKQVLSESRHDSGQTRPNGKKYVFNYEFSNNLYFKSYYVAKYIRSSLFLTDFTIIRISDNMYKKTYKNDFECQVLRILSYLTSLDIRQRSNKATSNVS